MEEAAEGAPSFLPQPRWNNRDVQPQQWGMRVAQFRQIIVGFMELGSWSRWIQEKGYVNVYNVIGSLVKPWTQGTGCGIALRMNPEEVLGAELMISHCWAEDIVECEEAIGQFLTKNSLEETIVMWFCAFAIYQPGDMPGDVGPTLAEQLNMDPFGSVIQAACTSQGMLVAHTSTAEVYDRLWCVYEINEALRTKCQVGIGFSTNYISNRGGRSLSDMLRARTMDAKCSNPSDEEMIRAKVLERGGFKDLDLKIFEFRLTSLQHILSHAGNELQQELFDELHTAENILLSGDLSRKTLKKYWTTPKRSFLIIALVSAIILVGAAVALAIGLDVARGGEDVRSPPLPPPPLPPPPLPPPLPPPPPPPLPPPPKERCIEWRWKEGTNIFQTPSSTRHCEDNVRFQDVYGRNCTTWTSRDCLSTAPKLGYTVNETFAVLQSCPVSCNLCECARWSQPAVPPPAPPPPSPPSPSPPTHSCIRWQWKQGGDINDSFGSKTIFQPPSSSRTCKDSLRFQDVYGRSCTTWTYTDCFSTVPKWGYTVNETLDVLMNCPVSCSLCKCAEWDQPLEDDDDDNNPLNVKDSSGDLKYIVLCIIIAIVAVCVALSAYLLFRRGHRNATSSEDSMSPSHMEHREDMKEDMKARLAALKAIMQDRLEERRDEHGMPGEPTTRIEL